MRFRGEWRFAAWRPSANKQGDLTRDLPLILVTSKENLLRVSFAFTLQLVNGLLSSSQLVFDWPSKVVGVLSRSGGLYRALCFLCAVRGGPSVFSWTFCAKINIKSGVDMTDEVAI